MRFSSGFIKLERKFINEFEGDVTQLGLMTMLVSSVNWAEIPLKYTKMGKTYEVQRGQFITTYLRLQQASGLSFRTIKSRLSALEKQGYIKLKSLKNCIRIAIDIDILQSESRPMCSTNEEYKNIRINKDISKDISSRTSSKKSLQLDQEDQKTKSDRADKRKNTSPEAQEGVSDTMSPDDLFRLWNEHCGALPKCRILSDSRKKKCKLRLKENPDPSYWKTVIEKLSRSTFANDGKWASFDWIIKNIENPDKAFSGNYDNKKNNSAWAPTLHDPEVKRDIDFFLDNAIRV